MSHKTPWTVSSDFFCSWKIWMDSCELTGENVFSVKTSKGIFEVRLSRERLILTNLRPAEYRDQFVEKWGHCIRELWDSTCRCSCWMLNWTSGVLKAVLLKCIFGVFLMTYPSHSNAENAQTTVSSSIIFYLSCFRISKNAKVKTWF